MYHGFPISRIAQHFDEILDAGVLRDKAVLILVIDAGSDSVTVSGGQTDKTTECLKHRYMRIASMKTTTDSAILVGYVEIEARAQTPTSKAPQAPGSNSQKELGA